MEGYFVIHPSDAAVLWHAGSLALVLNSRGEDRRRGEVSSGSLGHRQHPRSLDRTPNFIGHTILSSIEKNNYN